MFVTTQLNALTQIVVDQTCSEKVLETLNQKFVNLEATLLRAKVLREFSKKKTSIIIQSAITSNHPSLAYLFSPFILANLNNTVIYSTPLTEQVQQILKPYYQVERTLDIKEKDESVLESLNLFLDFKSEILDDTDYVYSQLIKALTQADITTIFLVTAQILDRNYLTKIEFFFNVRIFQIEINHLKEQSENPLKINLNDLNMHKLLFKRKDDFHVELCRVFSEMNAQLLYLSGLYDRERAKNLVEDMFYSEHIFEKLSVYAEYMQTRLQNNVLSIRAKTVLN